MDRTEKRLREEMNDIHQKMQNITTKAQLADRALTAQEKLDHSKLHTQILAKKDEMTEHIMNQPANGNGIPVVDIFDRTPGQGNSPKEAGAKLYKPDEKFYNASVIKDEADKMPAGAFLRSAMIAPQTPAERAAVQNSLTSSGFTLPTGVSTQIIDQLRELNPVIRAGAQSLQLPKESETNFVTITDYPAAVWHAELTEETTDGPTFGKITMSGNTLLSLFEVSRELEQDSVNIDEALRLAFVGSLNDAIIAATFTGPGANAPSGLDTLVTQTTEYTNGSTPDWSTMIAAQRKLYEAQVLKDKVTTIHAPDNWEALIGQTDSTDQFINPPRGIESIPEFVADGVPDGVSYTGDFSNVIYGFRMNLFIERHPSIAAKKFGALWMAGLRMDIAVFRPSALVRIEEAAA